MNTEPPFREILTVIAGLAAAGTAVELALIGHWNGPLQLIPWAVAYATITAAWATASPTRPELLHLARLLCGINVIVCGYGSILHLNANYEIAAELNPTMAIPVLLARAAQGRIPLLAPMLLALPSLLILVATWRHPQFSKSPQALELSRARHRAEDGRGGQRGEAARSTPGPLRGIPR